MMAITAEKEAISKLHSQIVVVAAGDREGALKWKDSHGVPFPVYLDLNCNLYHQLGLGHSVLILRIEAVCRYATKIVRKQPILPDYPGDDWFQMAGDFIVDDKGKLVFGHWGTDYNDRPSVSKILQELRVSESDH